MKTIGIVLSVFIVIAIIGGLIWYFTQKEKCTEGGNECASGNCINGLCQEPECTPGGNECTSGDCINGVCQEPKCTQGGNECETGKLCQDGVCLPVVKIQFNAPDEKKNDSSSGGSTLVLPLGTIKSSSVLVGMKLSFDGKEQGWGNECTSIVLRIQSLDGETLFTQSYPIVTRPSAWNQFEITPSLEGTIDIPVGAIAELDLHGDFKDCTVTVKNVILEVDLIHLP